MLRVSRRELPGRKAKRRSGEARPKRQRKNPAAGSGRQRKLPERSRACRSAYGPWSRNSPHEHQSSLPRKSRRTERRPFRVEFFPGRGVIVLQTSRNSLETLGLDLCKPHEGPLIGLLRCASKNNEVIEYALSRSLTPALVAEAGTGFAGRNRRTPSAALSVASAVLRRLPLVPEFDCCFYESITVRLRPARVVAIAQ